MPKITGSIIFVLPDVLLEKKGAIVVDGPLLGQKILQPSADLTHAFFTAGQSPTVLTFTKNFLTVGQSPTLLDFINSPISTPQINLQQHHLLIMVLDLEL